MVPLRQHDSLQRKTRSALDGALTALVLVWATGLALASSQAPGGRPDTGGAPEDPFTPGFLSGVIEVPEGLHFDLDTFGFFPGPTNSAGIVAELGPTEDPNGTSRFGTHSPSLPDPGVGESLGRQGLHGWQALTTDRGQKAWFEVLHAESPVVLRAVTRLGSSNRRPIDVQPLVCAGTTSLELWWTPRAEFSRYRVERRSRPGTRYTWVADLSTPPFVDEDALPGERWGYRVTGIDREGVGGVPSEVQGSLGIAGVHRGRVRMRAGVTGGVDLVRGVFEPGGSDLFVTGTYGGQSAASFAGALGRDVIRLDPERDPDEPLGLWITPNSPGIGGPGQNGKSGPGGSQAIESGGRFLLPIRGGGLALCTFEIVEDAYTIDLEYELYLDASVWPEGPRLFRETVDGSSFLGARSQGAFRAEKASVHDLILDTRLGELALGEGLTPFDFGNHATLLEVRVEGIDPRGRRSSPSSLRIDQRETGIRVGEFEVGLGDAYSIELSRPVGAEHADVGCDRVDARGRTATLRAPHGACNSFLRALNQRAVLAEDLQGALISFEPETLRWGPTLWTDVRTQIRQVFVLRTRFGGYALCRLLDVGGSPPRARVAFRFNPHAAVFREPMGREYLDGSTRFDHEALFGPGPVDPSEAASFDGSTLRSGHRRLEVGQDLRIPSGELGSEFDADLRYLQWNEQAGWSSIAGTHGICPVDLPDYGGTSISRERLFHSIRSIDPTDLRSLGQVRIAVETPLLDTFLLRCRDGGWAKLWVQPIEGSSDLDLHWTHAPGASNFGPTPADAERLGGVVLDRAGAFGLEPDTYDPANVHSAEFTLRMGEGWSFGQGALADDFAADLVLERLSGGLDGLRLRAEGGIRAAGDLGLGSVGNHSESVLYRRILGVRGESVWDFDAQVDKDTPESRVLLVKTRQGGLAKILIEDFGEGDRRSAEVRIRFVHTASGSAFAPRPDELRFTDELILSR